MPVKFDSGLSTSTSPATLPAGNRDRRNQVTRTRSPCCRPAAAQAQKPDSAATEVTRRQAVVSLGLAALVPALPALPAAAAPIEPFCGVVPTVPSWVFSTPWEERLVDFQGLKTWCRRIGKQPGKGGGLFGLFGSKRPASPQRLPLLCLHGGPGLPSRYLESLELLAGQEREVIFYDQIGCGNSFFASGLQGPAPEDVSPELFLEELAAVRRALGLDQVHLFGQGWGGMLALSAVLDGSASGIASLTLASTGPCYADLVRHRQGLLRQLPDDQQAALRAGMPSDPAGTAAYATARQAYTRRFLTRQPQVGCLAVAEEGRSTAVMQAMCGPSEFEVGGKLAQWDVHDRLAQVSTPTLILRGEVDELSEESAQKLQQGLQHAELVTLPGSASYVHVDAWEPCLEQINTFLQSHDPQPA